MRKIFFSLLIIFPLIGCTVDTTLDETDVMILGNMVSDREKYLTEIYKEKIQKYDDINIRKEVTTIDVEILNVWDYIAYSVKNNKPISKSILLDRFKKIDIDIDNFKKRTKC